jgi:hypothetical protein
MYAAKRFCCGPGADKRDPTKQFYINLFVYNTVVLGTLDPGLPDDVKARSGLSSAWRCFEKALDDFMQAALVAS